MLMELCITDQLKSLPLWLPLLLLALGSFFVSKLLFSFLKWVYVYFLRPSKNLKNYGSWALITGPTDGIGKAFAFQLARKGLNLVLVGRNPEKLKYVSDAILAIGGNTKIKTVVLDFSGDLSDGLRRIGEVIDGLDVGVLINNVGCCYPYARYVHELDDKLIADLIKINVEGTTKVTHAVLPGMLKRKTGAIVNIGSAGGGSILSSYPLYTVYAAAKGYVDQFSKSLYVEYKRSGIDVQCQVPCYIATKMASVRKSSFLVPSSDGYVRAALRWVGYEHQCTPYWPHSVLWALANSTPDFILDTLAFWYFLSLRKRGQLKDARKKN